MIIAPLFDSQHLQGVILVQSGMVFRAHIEAARGSDPTLGFLYTVPNQFSLPVLDPCQGDLLGFHGINDHQSGVVAWPPKVLTEGCISLVFVL